MLEERGVEAAWVARVLAAPAWSETDPRGPPLRRSYGFVPEADGRVLRVVHRREGDEEVIVTAHFDRGARP